MAARSFFDISIQYQKFTSTRKLYVSENMFHAEILNKRYAKYDGK